MKKLYSLLVFLCCSTQLHAQGYFPMLDSISNNWYYVSNAVPVRIASTASNCDYINSSYNFMAQKMFTSGDTIINSLTYKKLDQMESMIPNSECFFGFLREDTAAQKIYFKDNLSSPEMLLYDFSLQPGDSIYYDFVVTNWYYTSGYFKVDSIRTETIQAGPRRIFYLRNYAAPAIIQYPMQWIESVGHPGHLVVTHSGNTSNGGLFGACNDFLIRDFYQSLSCFEHYSQKVFFDSCAHAMAVNNWCFNYADSCNYWNICGSLEETGPISQFKVLPNPSSDPVTLFIESDRNAVAEIEVYDFSGKVLLSRELKIKQGINEELLKTDLLRAGSYLVILKHETGSLYRKLVRIP